MLVCYGCGGGVVSLKVVNQLDREVGSTTKTGPEAPRSQQAKAEAEEDREDRRRLHQEPFPLHHGRDPFGYAESP